MTYKIDPHCHSIASGHAYSTIQEIAKAASKKKIKMIGITDHGPSLPGGPHKFYFSNMKVLPKKIHGVEILKGIEANIIDRNGGLDLNNNRLETLDLVLAGLHDFCMEPGTSEENTEAMINAMKNPCVDIIVHPGNPVFPIDFHAVLEAAKIHNILIEINNSSLGVSRKGSEKNCFKIAELCKEHAVRIVIGSDSHISTSVGEFGKFSKIFKKLDMPEELIMNLSVNGFKNFLKSKGKKRFQ